MFEKQSQAVTVKQTLTKECQGKNTCRFFWNAFAAAASSGLKDPTDLSFIHFTTSGSELEREGCGRETHGKDKESRMRKLRERRRVGVSE